MILTEGRIVDGIAADLIVFGTPEELAATLEVRAEVFRAALDGLAEAGWIFVRRERAGRLFVGWERRAHDAGPPAGAERRCRS